MFRKGIYKIAITILLPHLVLVSTWKEFCSIFTKQRSSIIKIVDTNKTLVKIKISTVIFCQYDFRICNLHYLGQKSDTLSYIINLHPQLAHYKIFLKKNFVSVHCMNSSTDFSQILRTKSKQCQPKQLAWKKIRTLTYRRTETKFRHKTSNSYQFVSDIAGSNFTMTLH